MPIVFIGFSICGLKISRKRRAKGKAVAGSAKSMVGSSYNAEGKKGFTAQM